MNPSEQGQLIHRARQGKGWNQSRLATEVGVTQSAISMLERGTPNVIKDDKLDTIYQVLGLGLSASPEDAESLLICKNPTCPSLRWKLARNSLLPDFLFFEKDPAISNPICGCGEPLESRCPDCSAPILHQEFHCHQCGSPRAEIEAYSDLPTVKTLFTGLQNLRTQSTERKLLPSEFLKEWQILENWVQQLNQDLEAAAPRSKASMRDFTEAKQVIQMNAAQ